MIAIASYTRDGEELVDLYVSDKVYYSKNAHPCGGVLPMVNKPDGYIDRTATAELAKLIADAINAAHVEPKGE